jgi:hypothetical protein
MVEQFPPIHEVHDEVEFVIGLESVVEVDDERTLDLFKDISLS